MKKIGIYEFFATCYSLCVAFFPCFGTALIINKTGTSSLYLCFIGMILGFIPLLIIIYMFNSDINKNIFEYNKNNFKFIGSIFNLLYFLSFVFVGIIISWGIINFISTHLLPKNNSYIIATILFYIIALTVTKGSKVLSKCSLLLGYLFFFIIIFCFGTLSTYSDISNLLPMKLLSIKDSIYNIIMMPCLSVISYISVLSLRKTDIYKYNKANKVIILSYIIGVLTFLTFLFFVISIYGIDLAKLFSYPEYYIFKKINIFNFLQRIENILSITIFISFFGNLCALIYFNSTFINFTFNIKKKKIKNIIIYFLSIFVPLLAIYLFKNIKPYFLLNNFCYLCLPIFLVLFINFVFIFINKRINKKC